VRARGAGGALGVSRSPIIDAASRDGRIALIRQRISRRSAGGGTAVPPTIMGGGVLPAR